MTAVGQWGNKKCDLSVTEVLNVLTFSVASEEK